MQKRSIRFRGKATGKGNIPTNWVYGGGMMSHTQTFRKEIVPESVEIKNWFRPTLEQTLKMSDGTIEHILNGGLILEE